MTDDSGRLPFWQFLLGYVVTMIVVVGTALVLDRRYAIPGVRTVFVGYGSLFLLASSGRPDWLYHLIRNAGWFHSIRNRTAMRMVLAVCGLLCCALGVFTPLPR